MNKIHVVLITVISIFEMHLTACSKKSEESPAPNPATIDYVLKLDTTEYYTNTGVVTLTFTQCNQVKQVALIEASVPESEVLSSKYAALWVSCADAQALTLSQIDTTEALRSVKIWLKMADGSFKVHSETLSVRVDKTLPKTTFSTTSVSLAP